jgi:secondary thiamine-phosphate synthase enzyme
METIEVALDTSARRVIDLTGPVISFAAEKGDGLLHVFAPHATAGVGLMELGSGSEADLDALVERVLPRDGSYQHRHGSAGHGADHLLPLLVSPSLVLPVVGSRPALGTWQRVVFVDYNVDNPSRRVRLTFVSG